jgi:hypothetical protein
MSLSASFPSYKPEAYPAPRHPQFKAKYMLPDLLPIARELVRWPYSSAPLKAGYNIQKGQRALIVVQRDFDPLVLEAIATAIRERRALADIVLTDFVALSGGDGSLEAQSVLNPDTATQGMEGRSGFASGSRGFTMQNAINLVQNGGYDIMIEGAGGTHPVLKVAWQRIFWDKLDKFVVTAGYPYQILDAIDDITWRTVLRARKFYAKDPEGTDLTWTVKPSYWDEARETYRKGTRDKNFNIVRPGLISIIPMGIGPESYKAFDHEGVIAGTMNHAGSFPRIRVFVSKGSVVEIEGGGEFGQLWREALDKWKNVQWPDAAGPGINQVWEASVGTNPKGFRSKDALDRPMSNIWERLRSGIIHWGIGARSDFIYNVQMPEAFKEFQEKHRAPHGHVHIHTYFTTVEIETLDGKRITVIDKGHLTALDDPRVREIAAQYGNPDELLREIWIPKIPGINVPGEYWKDYAANPAVWVQKEISEHAIIH